MDSAEIESRIDSVVDTLELIESDPLAFTLFNPAQFRCFDAVSEKPDIIIARMPNGIGKTYGMVAVMGAIMWPTRNPNFDAEIFHKWPYRKELRIVSTSKAVEDNEAIQTAIAELWPKGRFDMARGAGKGYYSNLSTDTGFSIDVLTYNQQAIEHESGTKGAIFMSEPPPRRLMGSNLSRLRMGGFLYLEMTPLEYANYIKTDYEDKGGLFAEDGRQVGRIIIVTGNIEENCKDHTEGGQLPHEKIESLIASYPIEERELRKSGDYGALSGLIYKTYGDHNEIDELEGYWQECWDSGNFNLCQIIDPHDRKPWAVGWKAVFPNDDVVTIAEFPDENQPMFHEILSSPYGGVEFYRALTIATEKAIGRVADRRFMDPRFGNSPKSGEESNFTIKEMISRACKKCRDSMGDERARQECAHKLVYTDPPSFSGSIGEGHTLVRSALGSPREGKRPKLYHMRHCRNHVFAYRNYGWKQENHPEKRGISEDPELVHKDFPDLDRMFYLAGGHRYKEPVSKKALKFVKLKRRGRSNHV